MEDDEETVEPQMEPEPATDPEPEPAVEPEPDGLKDKHGQDAISRGRYEHDMQEKDAAIAALKDQLAEASKTAEGREKLEEDIAGLKNQIEADRTKYQLELAGCVNIKAANALLGDYDSIDALKEACPYLFNAKKEGSTGLKPAGAPNAEDAKVAEIREKIGLPTKKKG